MTTMIYRSNSRIVEFPDDVRVGAIVDCRHQADGTHRMAAIYDQTIMGLKIFTKDFSLHRR